MVRTSCPPPSRSGLRNQQQLFLRVTCFDSRQEEQSGILQDKQCRETELFRHFQKIVGSLQKNNGPHDQKHFQFRHSGTQKDAVRQCNVDLRFRFISDPQQKGWNSNGRDGIGRNRLRYGQHYPQGKFFVIKSKDDQLPQTFKRIFKLRQGYGFRI